MKKNLLLILSLVVSGFTAHAQSPGDTIVVPTLNYTSTTREMQVPFPNLPGVTYEKIYMMYNMRCKNGLVSPGTSGQTNIGCGEWDYTCNTYVTDSSKTDSTKNKYPSHIITGFTTDSKHYFDIWAPYIKNSHKELPNIYIQPPHKNQLGNKDQYIISAQGKRARTIYNTLKAIPTPQLDRKWCF